jgi:serine protease Do
MPTHLSARPFGLSVLASVVLVCGVGCRNSVTHQSASDPNAPVATTGTLNVNADRGEVMGTYLFRNIVKRENPVVVSITTEAHVSTSDLDEMFGGNDFFRRFFGMPRQPQEEVQRALGSGFLISADGEILTNNHVVSGAEQIHVGLFNDERKTYAAKTIGADPLTDCALIKLEHGPVNLPTAVLGNSGALEPGDWVLAIGNPFRLGHTVTVGVVSYKARPFAVTEGRFQNMLQTDASINPGNSGGPLIDVHGEVVGINAAILAGEGGGGNIGIGFAVPIDTVKALLPQLRQGHVRRARLGVQVQGVALTEDEAKSLRVPTSAGGALLSMVDHDSPAERAGLRAGDVIVEYDAKPVSDGEHLTAMVQATPVGKAVQVVFYRDGQRRTVTVTPDELKLEAEQAPKRTAGGGSSADFGLSLGNLTPDLGRQLGLPTGTAGALVENVAPDSPAAQAGVMFGDLIVEVNHQKVHSADDASNLLRRMATGQPVFLLLSRRGNQVFIEMRRE